MQGQHDVGPGEVQEVGIALEVTVVLGEPRAAEVLLGEAAALQQHPPGAVHDADPLPQQRLEPGSHIHPLILAAG